MRTSLLVAATSCLALALGTASMAQTNTTPSSPTTPAPGATDTAPSTTPNRSTDTPSATTPRAPRASTTPAAGPVAEIGAATLVGTDVKNSAGDNIGEIKDIMVDSSGKATSVILGTGGVLGLGERSVPISWDQVKISRNDAGNLEASTTLTKEQIEGMPEYTKDKGSWRPK